MAWHAVTHLVLAAVKTHTAELRGVNTRNAQAPLGGANGRRSRQGLLR